MTLVFRHDVPLPLPPAEAFERLRHFPRLYPHLHAIHEPSPPGTEPPLLGPGVAFEVAERSGVERRHYAFRVACFDPAALVMELAALTTTHVGPVRVRSHLVVAWRVAPAEAGCVFETRQTVRLARPWLTPLLLPASAQRAIQAHVEEETAAALRLLTSPTWPEV